MRLFGTRPVHRGPKSARDLVILGSSSSEALDYAIGPHASYHPFWAGAWRARGLHAPQMQDYIGRILADLPRDAVVLLNFGLADVLFNARYKAVMEGFYDFPLMVHQAADGILMTRDALLAQGFATVLPVFLAPVPALSLAYWRGQGPGRQLPNPVLGRMYHDIFTRVAAQTACLDTFGAMSQAEAGSWLLRPEFHRDPPDHHPDYLRMHPVIRDLLAPLEGIPPCRDAPLEAHYPFTNVFASELVRKGTTRRSTCR